MQKRRNRIDRRFRTVCKRGALSEGVSSKTAAPSAAVFAIIHSSCERAAADTKVLPPPQAGYIKNA